METTGDQKILYKEECYLIQGAIFEVYHELGSGFIEAVYQESLGLEFTYRKIPFLSQPEMEIMYKDQKLKHIFQPDFLCYDKIVVEIKALKETCDEHKAQLMNYLKVSKLRLGLLVNFGHFPRATVERIIL